MTLTEEIGAKIKYYRKKRGMKIVELAALLHKTGPPYPNMKADRSPWTW